MNKKFVIAFVFVLIIVNLSGCIDNQNIYDKTSGDTSKIELVDYFVESQERVTGGLGYGYNKLDDGFVYSDDVFRYFINGTIKNIAEEFFDVVIVQTYFLDEKWSVLSSFNDTIDDLGIGDTEFFYAWFDDQSNLEYAKDVRFEFEVILI